MKTNWFVILVLAAASMVGCASRPTLPESIHANGPNAPLVQPPSDFWLSNSDTVGKDLQVSSESEVRPGWLLKLSCMGDPQLNGDFRVAKDGTLQLPYQFTLKAQGLRLNDLQSQVSEHYRSYFKRDPQLRLRVLKARYWITLQGMVAKPGDALVNLGESLDVVLSRAGGADREARYVQVQRGENTFQIDLQNYSGSGFGDMASSRRPRWFGGEVLTVMKTSGAEAKFRSNGIEFLGEVRTPGELSFEPGADLYSYLVRAGGPSSAADLDDVQVVRMTKDGRKVVSAPADVIARNIRLSQGDIVIIGNTGPGKYERTLQTGSTLAAILSAIGILLFLPAR